MPARLPRFAWTVLAWNVAVILWGAYVRATGSGAGCGAHWPLCNGEIVPWSPTAQMLVEFSHRVTSGLALASVVALWAWTRRACPSGHPARRAAAWSLGLMLSEAAVGAALVLFRLVAGNTSPVRALVMSVHLTNTFGLLAALTLTVWCLSGGGPIRLRRRGAAWISAGFVALVGTGVTGAVAALGDTLYPPASLAQALAADVAPTSAALVRLRAIHPVVAAFVALALVTAVERLDLREAPALARSAHRVALLAGLAVAVGVLNVLLLAPVWMQLLHLLVADAAWIAYTWFAAGILSREG